MEYLDTYSINTAGYEGHAKAAMQVTKTHGEPEPRGQRDRRRGGNDNPKPGRITICSLPILDSLTAKVKGAGHLPSCARDWTVARERG